MKMLKSAVNAFFLALLPWGFMLPLGASAENIIKIAAPVGKNTPNRNDVSYTNISATFTSKGIESLDGFDVSGFTHEKKGESALFTFESPGGGKN